MERTIEDDHIRSARGGFRDLDGVLQCFCTRVGKVETVYRRRYDLAKFFNELQHRLVDDNIRLSMQEQTCLFANRFHYLRMTVTSIRHTDAAGKVQQFFAAVCINV